MYFTKDYLKKSKKEQEEILLKACEETQKAEEYLKKRLRIDRFSGMEFFNAYKKEKDIVTLEKIDTLDFLKNKNVE